MQKRILNPLTENEPSRVESVQREIVRVCATMERAAIYGVAATLLSTGETVLVRADELFPTASVIKVSIVAELHAQAAEGRLNLDTPVTIRPEDIMAGSGVLALLTPGLSLPLRDLAALTISVSDNTASNLCLAAVGGPDVVNARMHTEWDMPKATIHRPIKFQLTEHDPPHTATTTPHDFLTLLTALANGTIHSRAVSDAVLGLMETTQDNSMIPRHLAVNPFAKDLGVDTPPFVVSHKTGGVTGVRNDVGLICCGDETLAVALFVKESRDTRWTAENKAVLMVAEIARILAEAFFAPQHG